VINGLEYLNIEQLGFRRVERHLQGHEGVGETLDTNTNRTMAHVGLAGLWNGIVVHIDDTIQVESDCLGDFVKLLEIIFSVLDEGGESQRCKVADSRLVRRRVLNDFRAEIG